MKLLIKKIGNLKNSGIKEVINLRMKDFEELHPSKSDIKKIFEELCFCLLTANFSAKGGIKIQKEIGKNFLHLTEKELAKKLSELGHRFPNARANYIFLARERINFLDEILKKEISESEKRDLIVKNIKGLGMKEASHFLRNIGYKNLAIIDFHIIDLLAKEKLIEKPKSKSLTKNKYVEIENLLKNIAEKTNSNLGELDLYLWYEETGNVLK